VHDLAAFGQCQQADQGIAARRFLCSPRDRRPYVLKHPDRPAVRIVVPHHGSAGVKRGILRSILGQAELTADDFVKLL